MGEPNELVNEKGSAQCLTPNNSLINVSVAITVVVAEVVLIAPKRLNLEEVKNPRASTVFPF